MRRLTLIAPVLFLLALVAFGAVVYEAGAIERTSADRATAVHDAANQLDVSAYAQHIHAIAVDTAPERARLEQFAQVDVVTAAQTMERVGVQNAVHASVTGATPEDGGTALPGGGTLGWTDFSLSADGSYAALMRAEAAYERLPFPAEVAQFDIDASPSTTGKGTWHMILKIRMLAITTSL